jgi:hypothetical protein
MSCHDKAKKKKQAKSQNKDDHSIKNSPSSLTCFIFSLYLSPSDILYILLCLLSASSHLPLEVISGGQGPYLLNPLLNPLHLQQYTVQYLLNQPINEVGQGNHFLLKGVEHF